jgi:hypothetical protein
MKQAEMIKLNNAAWLASYIEINRENAVLGSHVFAHKTITKKDGSLATARRNGTTKTWKTRPNDFKIPVKYGLRDCFYITQDNAHEWKIVY